MAKISDAFPSKYLAAADLNGNNVTVTISRASIEEIGQGADKDRKIVLSFAGKNKQFVCNKTNAKVIAGLHGDDTDDWLGKSITLCPREVEFQGDMVLAIRVSLQRPAAPSAKKETATTTKTAAGKKAAPATEPEAEPDSLEGDPADAPF